MSWTFVHRASPWMRLARILSADRGRATAPASNLRDRSRTNFIRHPPHDLPGSTHHDAPNPTDLSAPIPGDKRGDYPARRRWLSKATGAVPRSLASPGAASTIVPAPLEARNRLFADAGDAAGIRDFRAAEEAPGRRAPVAEEAAARRRGGDRRSVAARRHRPDIARASPRVPARRCRRGRARRRGRAGPPAAGVSSGSPSHCVPNQSDPSAPTAMCRIDSMCLSRGSLCSARHSPVAVSTKRERRRHGRQVELFAAEGRVRLDAAIGDRERLPVREEDRLVRADSMRRRIRRSACIPRRSRRRCRSRPAGGEIVLRREEKPAIRENAPWPKKCRSGGAVKIFVGRMPATSKATANVPGRRAKATAWPRCGCTARSWPRAGRAISRMMSPRSRQHQHRETSVGPLAGREDQTMSLAASRCRGARRQGRAPIAAPAPARNVAPVNRRRAN